MSESPTKKQKTKQYYKKQAQFSNQSKKSYDKAKFLEAGMKGFLFTVNYRNGDGVREAYMILNKYYDQTKDPEKKEEETQQVPEKDNDDEEDIANQLENQIEKTKQETKQKSFNFQSVRTGTDNSIFIKTSIDNHKELGIQFVKDAYEKKERLTKSILRFLPIDSVCRANMKDILDSAGKLFDQYFLKEPTEYSIIFNRRYNNEINRDEVIKELADLISLKNNANKVNLKFPKFSVIVEVIKGLCCLAVLPNYLEWKKYNVSELCAEKDSEDGKQDNKEENGAAEANE